MLEVASDGCWPSSSWTAQASKCLIFWTFLALSICDALTSHLVQRRLRSLSHRRGIQ